MNIYQQLITIKMPKKELTKTEAIEEAVQDVHNALIENMVASKLVVDSQKRKESARFVLLKAKERLQAISLEYM